SSYFQTIELLQSFRTTSKPSNQYQAVEPIQAIGSVPIRRISCKSSNHLQTMADTGILPPLVVLRGNWDDWLHQLKLYLHINKARQFINLSTIKTYARDPIHAHKASQPKCPILASSGPISGEADFNAFQLGMVQKWKRYEVAMKEWEKDEAKIENLTKFLYMTICKDLLSCDKFLEASTPTEVFLLAWAKRKY
ncbi:hypothetical protein BT63DRAFT_224390, partial [Microthyrium microscopicum]